MIDPENLGFANALSVKEANTLAEALNEALTAMAHFGCDVQPMTVISTLHMVAKREAADAFKTHEMLNAPKEVK